MDKIDIIIPVKDRDKERIQLCINSLSGLPMGEVIVVNYGSKVFEDMVIKSSIPLRAIHYDKNPIWNKAHALNLGIKSTKSKYIMTVDCDMILNKELKERIVKNLGENNFLYNTNVRRIHPANISLDEETNFKKSRPWFGNNRNQFYSKANGGIQIYSRDFINHVGGVDEDFGVYFGAMDNRVYEQACMALMNVINLNFPMLHQEHENKKEDNLPEDERELAELTKIIKSQELNNLIEKNSYVRKKPWGEDKPHQDKYLNKAKNYIKFQEKGTKAQKEFLLGLYDKIQNSKNKEGKVLVDGTEYTVTIGK